MRFTGTLTADGVDVLERYFNLTYWVGDINVGNRRTDTEEVIWVYDSETNKGAHVEIAAFEEAMRRLIEEV